MRAVVQNGFGSIDVLEVKEIGIPGIADNEILVRVHAASVNALDWHATRGMPYLIRLDPGLRKPKDRVCGVDLAGRVVAVGRNVRKFQVGDDVFGGSKGSFAEHSATTEDRLARKPPAFTYEEAAALHVAGMTALQGLQKARLEAGQTVLINGAGGGVGTSAVQIARWMGARVTAVTRTENADLLRSIGADEVIDYHTQDFTRLGVRYDVIFDIGGNRSFADCRRAVTPEGTIVVVGAAAGKWLAPASRMLKAAMLSPFASQRIVPFLSRNDSSSLAQLAEIADAGHIRPVIDRQYALSETPEAIGYIGSGRARGKVVILISQ